MNLTFNIKLIDAPKSLEKLSSIISLDVADDFPISYTKEGKILSTFGDVTWDLTPYANRNSYIHFAFKTEAGRAIDEINQVRYKKLILWTIYGWRHPLAVASILLISIHLRKIIVLCIDNKIDIATLSHFPKVYEQLRDILKRSNWQRAATVMRMAFADRQLLGFFILTSDQLNQLEKSIKKYSIQHQTPYIPERILNNIIERCNEVVTRYMHFHNEMEDLYAKCLEIYDRARHEFGYIRNIADKEFNKKKRISIFEYYIGKNFNDLAIEYGIRGAIMEVFPAKKKLHIAGLSSYFSHVAFAAQILIAALTGMRNIEHGLLSRNCLKVREDKSLGRVFFISGSTTKTMVDRDANWVTSAMVENAVNAASSISKMRITSAIKYSGYTVSDSQKSFLFPPTSEPWIGGTSQKRKFRENSIPIRFGAMRYIMEKCIHLFPENLLKITAEDLDIAIRITPDLDRNRFQIGEPWPLAWHQLRRTFVCNALSAGVSLSSISWQIKHAGTAMTLHYGANFFCAPIDKRLKKEFEEAQVEFSRIKITELQSEEFVAANRIDKNTVLRTINSFEGNSFKTAVLDGRIAIKATALGICTNPSPCQFGGWENVAECVKCAQGLIKKTNRNKIEKMLEIVETDLSECSEKDLLLSQSLNAQKNAILEALRVIKIS